MRHTTRIRRLLVHTATFALALVLTGIPSTAAAQAAAKTQYDRVLAREQAARRAKPAASVATLRSIAVAYEAIPRRFPRSGYSDNALWQAAGVLELAYARGKNARDRDQAIKLLRWLRDEYPSSSLRRQAITRLTALTAPPKAPVQNASAEPAPSPAAPRVSASPAAAPEATPEAMQASAVPASTTTAARVTTAAGARPEPARLLGPVSPPSPSIAGIDVVVTGLTHAVLPKGDRITISLSRETTYSNERVSAPDRVFIDLSEAKLAPSVAADSATVRGALVRVLEIGAHPSGTTRLALELIGQPRYSVFPLYDPFRLVIDIEDANGTTQTSATATRPASTGPAPFPVPSATVAPVSSAPIEPEPVPVATTAAPSKASGPVEVSTASAAPVAAVELPAPPVIQPQPAPEEEPELDSSEPSPAPPAITARGDYSLARQLGLGVSRIVIDPGHGGHDPGAKANGVSEAELVLDVALRLERLLLAHPGVEVVLTRRTNKFIPLEERTAIANRENADLFLSIHANSSKNTQTRGVETFFLNFATNPQAEAVAARENASSVGTMNRLPQLLQAIALNNKLHESRELATMVQTSLVQRLRPRNDEFKDLGVKQAPFVVLIGAGMPSVLSEIAFLTNRTEAAQLKQGAYRQRIAEALADAVIRYQASLKKGVAVASVEGPQ